MSGLDGPANPRAGGPAATAIPPAPDQLDPGTSLLTAVEALSENFPVTRAIVDEVTFMDLAISHARRFPLDPGSVEAYGRDFPTWLEGEIILQNMPFLVEVARCDRMELEARHAEDAPAFDLGALARIGSAKRCRLRLKLHPATRFAWLSTPALEIWFAHRREHTGEIASDGQSGGVLVTRPSRTVELAAIDAPTHRLLHGIRLGETLGEAIAAAESLYPYMQVGSCLADIVRHGALADCE